MDDVGMSDDSFVSMLALLKEVLACARNGKVLFSAHKLQLCMDKITWGGVEISSEGHTIDKDRVERIHRIAEPLISVQEVRMFLQMVTWNARYVLMLADALVPLTSLLKKSANLVWGPEQSAAFNKVKRLLTEKVYCRRPDFSKPWFLMCVVEGDIYRLCHS